MKIQYASDLHLEFPDNTRFLRTNSIVPVGDILVLAGDIGLLDDDTFSSHPFWDWAADNFKQTLVIPGNHEFYIISWDMFKVVSIKSLTGKRFLR